MRPVKLLLLSLILGMSGTITHAADHIVKVLPHFLDQQGRHTLSPSLYERDAYQAFLRKHPDLISAVRFDVQWKAKPIDPTKLKLRVEVRGSKSGLAVPIVVEQSVQAPKFFSKWTDLSLDKETYEKLGEMVAWRVTIWDGDQQVAEQTSFLW